MGEIIKCGERTVQTKCRVTINDIAEKHGICPGDTVNVIIQKVEEHTEELSSVDSTIEKLTDLLNYTMVIRGDLKILEDPETNAQYRGFLFRNIEFNTNYLEREVRAAINMLGGCVGSECVNDVVGELPWHGDALLK
ncbi:MAG: hypothetical protein M0R51_14580 [Clostridia bacterium]|jgi:RAB protein geranylgeranyltransferase component A|nr:hypothetical protein [Clostridia bacterium]